MLRQSTLFNHVFSECWFDVFSVVRPGGVTWPAAGVSRRVGQEVPAGQRVVRAKLVIDPRRRLIVVEDERRRARSAIRAAPCSVCPPRVKVAIWPFGVCAGGQVLRAAPATCGRLPATDCSTARPASVGAPLSVKPEPSCRSVHR